MHSKHTHASFLGPQIALALLTVLISGGPLLAAGPDTEIAGAHPLFVLKEDGTLSILNTETYQAVGTVTMGSYAGSTAVSPDGHWLVTVDAYRNSVSILDTDAIQVTTVAVGMGPVSVVMSPDSQRAYVLNKYDSTV